MKQIVYLSLVVVLLGVASYVFKPPACGAACPTKSPDLSAQAFSSLSQTDQVTVLDVRTPEEYATGHLENAKNINFNDTEAFLSQIDTLDKTKPYILYCRTGNRSAQAMKFMKNRGFTNVSHLSGGILSFTSAGIPIK